MRWLLIGDRPVRSGFLDCISRLGPGPNDGVSETRIKIDDLRAKQLHVDTAEFVHSPAEHGR